MITEQISMASHYCNVVTSILRNIHRILNISQIERLLFPPCDVM